MKRVKMEEKLLWMAYRNSPTLFRTVPSPTPYGLPFLEIWGFQLSYPLSGTDKATDFKFGGYIYRVTLNKSPLKILEKMKRGHIQGMPKFFGYPYFVGTFIGSIGRFGTKAHEKCWKFNLSLFTAQCTLVQRAVLRSHHSHNWWA